jgi:membrane-associated phospholipid phosphatase
LALSALDRWTLGYVALATAAVVTRGSGMARAPILLAHVLLVSVALVAPRARRAGAVGAFLGEFYPLIVDVALYSEIGLLNAAAGVAHDGVVQTWEAALFSAQPSRDWIRAQPWPWLSWPLHLGYLSYYFILAGAPLVLWWSGRREAARRTILLTMVAFYVCYSTFLFFPVAGPRYLFPLARNAATAVAPAVFTQRLLDGGAAWGTAFPSSHVAVALVASLSAWRGWRGLGVVLVPAALLLSFGTVYGQFHYAVDALAGAGVAVVVLAAGRARIGPS